MWDSHFIISKQPKQSRKVNKLYNYSCQSETVITQIILIDCTVLRSHVTLKKKKYDCHLDIAVLDRIIRKHNTSLLPLHALLPQLHLEVITSRPGALLPVSASWLAPVRSYKCALLSCPPVKYSGLDLPKTHRSDEYCCCERRTQSHMYFEKPDL